MAERPEPSFLYKLFPTTRTELRVCPFCRREQSLVVMEPERGSPVGMQIELILQCPSCHRLAVPAGIVKRMAGLALVVPFLVVLGAALAAAGWMIWMMATTGGLNAGFTVLALLLALGAVLAGRPALRTFLRLVRPRALLPLGRSEVAGQSVDEFRGEL